MPKHSIEFEHGHEHCGRCPHTRNWGINFQCGIFSTDDGLDGYPLVNTPFDGSSTQGLLFRCQPCIDHTNKQDKDSQKQLRDDCRNELRAMGFHISSSKD